MEFLPVQFNGCRVYAGFWKRFCAGLVDAFVLMPLAFFFVWLEGLDKNLAILAMILSTTLFSMYNIYFNAHFGGTLGKLAVGIRITKPGGTRIGWPQAWKRSAVDLVFAILILSVEIVALTRVSNEQYSATTFTNRAQVLQSHYPSWFFIVMYLQQIWVWSEVVVLLFNKRRRALHDFIAGTVVMHKDYAEQPNGERMINALTPNPSAGLS
jgi:uncharacterized RDD family membrane protein YckC